VQGVDPRQVRAVRGLLDRHGLKPDHRARRCGGTSNRSTSSLLAFFPTGMAA
jgi:hypothetical protein